MTIRSNKPFSFDEPFLSLDVETTGTDELRDEIIQLAATLNFPGQEHQRPLLN